MKTIKPKYTNLTSIDSLSSSVFLFGIFYGIKLGAFSYDMLAGAVPNDYIRIVMSIFFGVTLSKVIRDIVVNLKDENERVSIYISIVDFFLLTVILDLFANTHWAEMFYKIVFSLFVASVGYWINRVFKEKVQEHKSKDMRGYAEYMQNRADYEQKNAKLVQQNALLEQEHAEQNKALAYIEEKVQAHNKQIESCTCSKCGAVLNSVSAKNRHEKNCKKEG